MSQTGNVSAHQLQTMLHDGREIALLDVRETGQFGESHLLFATPLPYSRLEIDIAPLVPRKSARIVLCDDGALGTAELAAKRLLALGYTDVSVLDGGTRAWAAAGHALFAGVNVPSKLFGELVEHAYHTPRVSVTELARMKEAGEDFVIVDGRPYGEYQKMNIPGGICCPNAELPYRIHEIVRNPHTRIIVNCAGRTRSILGAQTLINFGVPNPVYALENGTQGWVLANLDLERGAARRYPEGVDAERLPMLRERAQSLMRRHDIQRVSSEALQSWLGDVERTTYVIDVRTPEEYAAGSVRGAVHAPGGQLIQATDQWVGVRNARIVLVDSEGVRAPVVASWLKQLGFEAYVLSEGVQATVSVPAPEKPALPSLATVTPAQLKDLLESDACAILDLGSSMRFRKAHVPGSHWSIRPRVAGRSLRQPVVVLADEDDVARAAAVDLQEAHAPEVKLLPGGLAAWQAAGYATEASENVPPDAECIDYLFFVHDRHAGNREAMRQYLAWETGLIAQLEQDDRALFKVGTASVPHVGAG